MVQIIAVVSLSIFLAFSAFVWSNWDSPRHVDAAAGPRSIAVDDVMQKVDLKALPNQQMQDRAMVFPDGHDQ